MLYTIRHSALSRVKDAVRCSERSLISVILLNLSLNQFHNPLLEVCRRTQCQLPVPSNLADGGPVPCDSRHTNACHKCIFSSLFTHHIHIYLNTDFLRNG